MFLVFDLTGEEVHDEGDIRLDSSCRASAGDEQGTCRADQGIPGLALNYSQILPLICPLSTSQTNLPFFAICRAGGVDGEGRSSPMPLYRLLRSCSKRRYVANCAQRRRM